MEASRVDGLQNFLSQDLGDDLAIHLMQFLEPRDALHLSKTCRRMAIVYKQQRRQLRRWKQFSDFRVYVEMSPRSSISFDGYGTTYRQWDHRFNFCDATTRPDCVDFVLSNEDAELAIQTERTDRSSQWKHFYEEAGKTPAYEEPRYEKVWSCFVQKGTPRQAFVLLAEFISDHFAFEFLEIARLDKEMSRAISKFCFYVSGRLDLKKNVDLDEKELLNWAGMPRPQRLTFSSTTAALTLSKTFFEDPRIRKQKGVEIRLWADNRGSCDLGDEDLERVLLTTKTNIVCENVGTRVTLSGLKTFIDKWRKSDESFFISSWTFGIQPNEEDDIKAWCEAFQDTDDPRRCFYVDHDQDKTRQLLVHVAHNWSATSSPLPFVTLQESKTSAS